MKNISTIWILILCLSAATFSQTELWRIPTPMVAAVTPSNDGTFYLHYESYYGYYDTLKKVDPLGNILWQKKVDPPYQVLPSSDGVYALFNSTELRGDSVVYYDLSGNNKWKYITDISKYSGGYVLSSDNKLYLITEDISSRQLIRLNTLGEVDFQLNLPVTTGNFQEEWFNGPYLDENANIWILHFYLTHIDQTKRTTNISMNVGNLEVLKIDPTGNLLWKSNVMKNDILELNTEDANGNRSQVVKSYPQFSDVYIANGYLTCLYTFQYDKWKINPSGKIQMQTSSEWRILSVNPQGKSKLINYKGKGNCYYIDPQSIENVSENKINGNVKGNGDAIYIAGTRAIGKNTNDRGNYRIQSVVMKYSISKQKVEWLKAYQDITIGGCLITKSQKIGLVEGMYFANKIAFIDTNGNLSTTKLNLSDYIPNEHLSRAKSLNMLQENSVYLPIGSSGWMNLSLAKYSLPTINFTQKIVNQYVEEPVQFKFDQNYPNPFNPTTTIPFELASNALVTVKVYNTLGQEVAVLANREEFTEGTNQIEFDGSMLSSGIYFYKIVAEDLEGNGKLFTSVKKMILMK